MPYKDPIKAREASRKSSLKYYYNHTPTPEQEARKKIARKAWEIKNASKLSDYQHKRWLRDKDKMSLRKKNYKMNNEEKVSQQKKNSYQKYREQILSRPSFKLYGYKKSAKERGYEFNLSTEDFNKLLLENCHYCGKEKSNGVDRKENSLGYFAENVVPCCKTCNFMKRDLSYREFKEHIKKIHSHLVNEKNLLSGRFEHRVFLTS